MSVIMSCCYVVARCNISHTEATTVQYYDCLKATTVQYLWFMATTVHIGSLRKQPVQYEVLGVDTSSIVLGFTNLSFN